MADFEETFKGCFIIFFILIFSALIAFNVIDCRNERKENPEVYLVRQTRYIHKSEEKGLCRYYDASITKGYTTEKIRIKDASKERYNICLYCFSIEERARYIKLVQKVIEQKKYEEDLMKGVQEYEEEDDNKEEYNDYYNSNEPEDLGGIYSSRQHP